MLGLIHWFILGSRRVNFGIQRSGANMSKQRNKLLQSIFEAELIFESAYDWDYKFDRIFNLSHDIKQLISELGPGDCRTFDYHDFDVTDEGSLREDVTAYIEALRKVKKNLVWHEGWLKEMCSRYQDGLVTFEDTVDAVFLDVICGHLGRKEFVEVICGRGTQSFWLSHLC